MEFVMNGQASGSLANTLLKHNFNPGCLRPYVEDDGVSYMTVNQGQGAAPQVVVANAAATLRKQEWEFLDQAVVAVAKPRLKVVNWLRTSGLVYNLPNAMGHPVFQTETQTDITPARISMDGLAHGDSDRPEYELTNLPIPIISKGFQINARQLAASRNGGSPLDTSTVSLATRRVVEQAETLAIGANAAYKYGGGTVYGLINSPLRQTTTFRDPADVAWTPEMFFDDVAAMIALNIASNMFGPYRLLYSAGLAQYVMRRFNTYDGRSLLQVVREGLPSLTAVEQADYMTGKQLVLVQETDDVARLVFGMDVTTLQWESMGGLLNNFLIMAIMVPQIRADAEGQCGVVHATAVAV